MEIEEENNLVIRITKFGLKNQKFTWNELCSTLNLTHDEKVFVEINLIRRRLSDTDSPNHLIGFSGYTSANGGENLDSWYFSLLPNALFSYVDYLEIKQARIHAEQANKKSDIAIRISIAALIASIVLGIIQIFVSMQ